MQPIQRCKYQFSSAVVLLAYHGSSPWLLPLLVSRSLPCASLGHFSESVASFVVVLPYQRREFFLHLVEDLCVWIRGLGPSHNRESVTFYLISSGDRNTTSAELWLLVLFLKVEAERKLRGFCCLLYRVASMYPYKESAHMHCL